MENNKKITEEELDAIYQYLSISFDEMEEDEKMMWTKILMEVDPEFNTEEDEED
jgi:hypothetical protein